MYLLQSPDELRGVLRENPELWLPDNLLFVQEYFPTDPDRGIVRMEFLGGELLYAIRFVSHGVFNLCPSEVCNPDGGREVHCALPEQPQPARSVEFYPYPAVPRGAVETGKRLAAAAGLDVGGIEYLETADGRLVFYDVNANSNLRRPIGEAFGFDPFQRVVDFLISRRQGLIGGAAP